MGRKAHPSASGTPLSIRISDQLKTDLATAAAELGMAEYEVTRLAMQIGLKHFAAIDYDLAAAVMSKSGLVNTESTPAPEKPHASTVNLEATPATAKIVPLPSPSELNNPRDIAAEPQATGTGPQMRKPATYDSLKRPKK